MTAPVASLPMYDLPELRDATDALWTAIATELRAEGFDPPPALTRGDPDPTWRAPTLLLSQTCGYPLVTRLRNLVRVVATPIYDVEACEGPRYRSALVVRADSPARTLTDLRDTRCALNDRTSHSGMNALRAMIAELVHPTEPTNDATRVHRTEPAHAPTHAAAGLAPTPASARFFADVLETGTHRASLAAVRTHRADLAAIDGVSLALIARGAPDELTGTRVLAWTHLAPALPFVTAASHTNAEVARIHSALARALTRAPDAARALALTAIVEAHHRDYAIIADLEQRAIRAGYPTLA